MAVFTLFTPSTIGNRHDGMCINISTFFCHIESKYSIGIKTTKYY